MNAKSGFTAPVLARAFYTNLVSDSKYLSPWVARQTAPAARTDANAHSVFGDAIEDEVLGQIFHSSARKHPTKLSRVAEARDDEVKASAEWAASTPVQPRFTLLGQRRWWAEHHSGAGSKYEP